MNVAQLIEELKKLPQEALVFVSQYNDPRYARCLQHGVLYRVQWQGNHVALEPR